MGNNVFKMRPYARLLTMLGEQLIKNEKIALMELIKNSYDADADWVQVRLSNVKIDEDKLILNEKSVIEIEDDGEGMTFEVLKDSWMNPATPIKLKQKGNEETRRTPEKKRIIQGEKGIGRFAIYKLGRRVEIISRSKHTDQEIYINSDITKYDDDFLTENDSETGVPVEKKIYLDQLEVAYEIRKQPSEIIEREIVVRAEKLSRKPQGTIIRIYGIKGEWSIMKLKSIQADISKLEFPFNKEKSTTEDFLIDIQLNGKSLFSESEIEHELTSYFEKAPIIVKNGHFDDKEQKFEFELNGKYIELSLDRFSGSTLYKKRFTIVKGDKLLKRRPECGPFDFEFHVFDLSSKASSKFTLSSEDKKVIKKHRIYLYRDQIRVYPYGDPDDDWIGLDVKRGTSKAGDYLSNDQTVGYVGISQKENPELKDKTNREGLIELGSSFEDFKTLLLTFFGYLNQEFKKYQKEQQDKDIQTRLKEEKIKSQLDLFEEYLKEKGDKKSIEHVKHIVQNYSAERKYLVERAEKTEDLAGVGLAVETASHDIMVMIGRAKDNLDLLVKAGESGKIDLETLVEDLHKLRGQISFVEDQLEGIQPMFRSTKRRSKNHRVKDIVESVKKYFDSLLLKKGIQLKIEQIGSPIIVKSNEGVLMQAFINLLDNSIYWLGTVDVEYKEVKVILNGDNYEVTVADNGPGIWKDDLDYIFDPFFSTKGVEGRGLGLYIVRQLLERYDFTIEYVSNQSDKVLSGANFRLHFKP